MKYSAFVSESISIIESLYGVLCTTRVHTKLEDLFRRNLLHGSPTVVAVDRRFVCLATDTAVAVRFRGSNIDFEQSFDHDFVTSEQTLRDWHCNIDMKLSSAVGICLTGLLHSGFAACYRELQPHVKSLLHRLLLQQADLGVWLMGHSLGGAIALLCAMSLDTHLHHRTRMCTLGAPCIGDNMANTHSQKISRIYYGTAQHGPLWDKMET